MLQSINLSLTSYCGANCIYCPTNRGKNIKQKIMPLSLVQKIIDEITSDEFTKKHKVKRIILGENGDAFLNKELIDILRYIRLNSDLKIILYTNFQHFTKENSEKILKEGLVDLIRCNIDGHNSENYFTVKKIEFNNFKHNLVDFLDNRKKYHRKVPIHVSVLTLNNYVHTIHKNLKVYPLKMNDKKLMDIKDDFNEIKLQFGKILDKKRDDISKSYLVGGWAERDQIDINKINYNKYACPNLLRVTHEAFIAPDATWYACCLDSAHELSFGNLHFNSIEKIYSGEKRKEIIKNLDMRNFKEIGGPCATVNCCQWMHRNKLINEFHRLLFKNKVAVKILYNYFSIRQ